MIKKAVPSMADDIINLDKSVIGSLERKDIIRQAVKRGQCYVVETNRSITAFGIMNYSFYEKGFVSLLVVAKEHRRKGYGKALMEAFKDLCITDKLFTSTNRSNLPMQRLLDSCGFKRCGMVDELDEGDPELVYCYNKKCIENCKNKSMENAHYREPGNLIIAPMTWEQICDINKLNQPFKVFGRLVPTFENGKWAWKEELFEKPYEKLYPNDELDYSDYIGSPDKIVFMAYMDGMCTGQIRLRRNWNKYCYIEDVAVRANYHRQRIGTKLVKAATEWAKEGGMSGLMLETQDTNLAACRFYQKCGFVLGGVDIMLYGNTPNKDEKALYWYIKFKP